MKLHEIDEYFQSVLHIRNFTSIDSSQNGLQVECRRPKIQRVAFSVDASMQTFEAAVQWNADMLFVHHGLFWGSVQTVTGVHYKHVQYLLEHNMALYAVHLPLDAHEFLGNNAGIAQALDLRDTAPFGLYRGVPIGVRGVFHNTVSVDEVLERINSKTYAPLSVLRFGPEKIQTVGIISGGAPLEAAQAVEAGLDMYITGDANHIAYHMCREAGIHAIFAGHYASEVWGVQLVAQFLKKETNIETTFLDIPTGL